MNFMTLALGFEFSGAATEISSSDLGETVARHFFEQTKHNVGLGNLANSLVTNFNIVWYIAVVKLVTGSARDWSRTDPTQEPIPNFIDIEGSLANSEYKSGCAPGRPCYWGNMSMITDPNKFEEFEYRKETDLKGNNYNQVIAWS